MTLHILCWCLGNFPFWKFNHRLCKSLNVHAQVSIPVGIGWLIWIREFWLQEHNMSREYILVICWNDSTTYEKTWLRKYTFDLWIYSPQKDQRISELTRNLYAARTSGWVSWQTNSNADSVVHVAGHETLILHHQSEDDVVYRHCKATTGLACISCIMRMAIEALW